MWSVEPTRPLTSRRVTSPYNYPFSDNVPTVVADLVGRMVSDAAWYLAPVLGEAQLTTASLGLTTTLSADIWGPSKNTLLYLNPPPAEAGGFLAHAACGSATQQVFHDRHQPG